MFANEHLKDGTSRLITDDFISRRVICLEQERREVELNLIGALVAHPARGVKAARAHGVRVGLISGDDLQTIILAVKAIAQCGTFCGDRRHDRSHIGVLAKHGLQSAGWWDDSQTSANFGSSLWSDASLSRLFDLYPGPEPIEPLARELVAIDRRQRQLQDAYDHLMALLDDSDSAGVGADVSSGMKIMPAALERRAA